jgi:hypothetical protein
MPTFNAMVETVSEQIADGVAASRHELAAALVKATPKKHWRIFERPDESPTVIRHMMSGPFGEEEAFALFLNGLRRLNYSEPEQIKFLRTAIMIVKHAEWHSGLRALWQVGLSDEGFIDLSTTKTCMHKHQSCSDAAYDLRLVATKPKDNDEMELAQKALTRALNGNGKTIILFNQDFTQRGIDIPLLYYPFKTDEELAEVRKNKKRITGKEDLGEEDGLVFPPIP